jgi:hypothetical protein
MYCEQSQEQSAEIRGRPAHVNWSAPPNLPIDPMPQTGDDNTLSMWMMRRVASK